MTVATPLKKIRKSKTLLALVALLVSVLINYAVLAWIHERVPYGSEPLPDLFFSLVDEYPTAITVAECLLVASIGAALSIAALHEYRWIVIRRLCLIASACYTLRAICVASTQVPVPSRNTYCDPVADRVGVVLILERIRDSVYACGMDLYFRRVLCGDLVFSGHTIAFALSHLIADRYSPDRFSRPLSFATKWTAVLGPLCVLLARKHYTLDVILAYAICYLTFSFYHYAAEANNRGQQNARNDDGFVRRLIRFMESDMDDVVVINEFCSFSRMCASSSGLRKEITIV